MAVLSQCARGLPCLAAIGTAAGVLRSSWLIALGARPHLGWCADPGGGAGYVILSLMNSVAVEAFVIAIVLGNCMVRRSPLSAFREA